MTVDQHEAAERVELFHGEISPVACRVYARLRPASSPAGTISGTLTGPFTRYARTLTTTLKFQPVAGSASPLSTLSFPDFCYWTPEQPHQYQARIRVSTADGKQEWEVERRWGVRGLSIRSRRFYWGENAEAWTLHGIRATPCSEEELLAWRETRIVAVVEGPDDRLCCGASEIGVALVAVVAQRSPTGPSLDEQLRRLAQYPAVMLAIVDAPSDAVDPEIQDAAPNLLLAAWREVQSDAAVPPWARVLLVREEHFVTLADQPSDRRPMLLVRSAAHNALDQRQRACQEFAGHYASAGGPAGYIMW